MCSTPSAPVYTPAQTEPIATPTYADASVQKAGEITRRQAMANADKNIRTSALGLVENANIKKTKLGE